MTTEAGTRRPEFVAYEYATVRVGRDKESLYRDVYASFGWTIEGYLSARGPGNSVTLKMKRDRRIKNRAVVTELQRKAEEALASLENLERSRTTTATAAAWFTGLVGAGLLAGSIFSLDAGLVPLFLVLGVAGLLLWVAPFYIHATLRARCTAQACPHIDREYDVIHETAEQAAGLLA